LIRVGLDGIECALVAGVARCLARGAQHIVGEQRDDGWQVAATGATELEIARMGRHVGESSASTSRRLR
jgi:hypothetical protein